MKKICVIGAGNWGLNHIRTLSELDALNGVVESDSNKLRHIQEAFKCKTHLSLEEALNFEYDGYVIATPASTHFKLGMKVIESKKPLLIEKPLALNSKEADHLVKSAKKMKVNLMVGHLLLFHPAIKKIKEMIDNNYIGDLQYIYSNRLNLGTIRTEENVFWSFAPHDISIFNFFTNSEPLEVQSFGGDFIQQGIHDTTITSFIYNNNVKAHIFVSWLHPFKEHRLIVIGSKGMLRYEDSSENKELIFYDKGVNWKNGIPIKKDGESKVISFSKKMPLNEELSYFIDNLNSSFEIANGQSGLSVVKILERSSLTLENNK